MYSFGTKKMPKLAEKAPRSGELGSVCATSTTLAAVPTIGYYTFELGSGWTMGIESLPVNQLLVVSWRIQIDRQAQAVVGQFYTLRQLGHAFIVIHVMAYVR